MKFRKPTKSQPSNKVLKFLKKVDMEDIVINQERTSDPLPVVEVPEQDKRRGSLGSVASGNTLGTAATCVSDHSRNGRNRRGNNLNTLPASPESTMDKNRHTNNEELPKYKSKSSHSLDQSSAHSGGSIDNSSIYSRMELRRRPSSRMSVNSTTLGDLVDEYEMMEDDDYDV